MTLLACSAYITDGEITFSARGGSRHTVRVTEGVATVHADLVDAYLRCFPRERVLTDEGSIAQGGGSEDQRGGGSHEPPAAPTDAVPGPADGSTVEESITDEP